MVLIRWSGIPHCSAVVAAPMRKLWPENCPEITAPCKTDWMQDDRRERVKGRPWMSMNRGPDESPRRCKYARMAEIGQRGAWPRPRYMKHSWRSGSVFELLMHTRRLEGLTSASICKSWTVKWMDGSKVELTVNSSALKNPKKPRQQAAHSMTCSELWVSKERWINRMRWAVTGWRCGKVEPWWRLMPLRRCWSWRQFSKESGKPWSMCKDRIAER